MEKTLLDKVNQVRRHIGAEPVKTADPAMYKPIVGTSAVPEQWAYTYDHPKDYGELAEAPGWYRKLFDAEARPAVRDAAQVVADAGFPRIVTDEIGSLSRPVPEKVTAWGEEYGGVGTPWLWLTGGTGAGKTCTAAVAVAIAGRRVDEGEATGGRFEFVSARDMTELVDGSGFYRGRDGKATKHEMRQKWLTCDLLVLDDLGLERHTATSWDTLSRVIDGRQAEKLPTIITCPYSGSVWFDFYKKVDAHERGRLAGRMGDAMSGWTHKRAELKRHTVDLTDSDGRIELAS